MYLLDGLDICYPSEHQLLMDKIIEKGLLISEYPPGTRPTRYNFPKRNRLISAWSDKEYEFEPAFHKYGHGKTGARRKETHRSSGQKNRKTSGKSN